MFQKNLCSEGESQLPPLKWWACEETHKPHVDRIQICHGERRRGGPRRAGESRWGFAPSGKSPGCVFVKEA